MSTQDTRNSNGITVGPTWLGFEVTLNKFNTGNAYHKTEWVDNQKPAISADNLGNIESGINTMNQFFRTEYNANLAQVATLFNSVIDGLRQLDEKTGYIEEQILSTKGSWQTDIASAVAVEKSRAEGVEQQLAKDIKSMETSVTKLSASVDGLSTTVSNLTLASLSDASDEVIFDGGGPPP